jgi:hypothetical protein
MSKQPESSQKASKNLQAKEPVHRETRSHIPVAETYWPSQAPEGLAGGDEAAPAAPGGKSDDELVAEFEKLLGS